MKEIKYETEIIEVKKVLDKNEFSIPQYQRSIVWDKKRKNKFLRNVLNGEPVGVILYKPKKVEGEDKLELIDGLQRISTIKSFDNNPYEYLNSDDIELSWVKKLIRVHLDSKGESEDEEEFIKNHSEEWKEKIFESFKQSENKSHKFMTRLRRELDLEDEDDINDVIDDFFTEFRKTISLENLKICGIKYKGPEEDIPDVFYYLNTGGVQLTKYDTFAATWTGTNYNVNDEELIDIIVAKYTKLEDDSDMFVDYNEADLYKKGISLFEYCYAIGGIMQNKDKGFNILFNPRKKQKEWIGFDFLALLLINHVNDAKKLYNELKDVDEEFVLKLKDIIKEGLEVVSEVLSPLLHGINQSSLQANSNYMSFHILASYILEYYDIRPKEKIITTKNSCLNKEKFKKYAPIHYFHDCISDLWSDKRQTDDLDKSIIDEEQRRKYWYPININKWEKALDTFMDSQLETKHTIPQKNKLFIDFLTKLKKKESPEYRDYFTKQTLKQERCSLDIEHIVPKKVVNEHIDNLSNEEQKIFPMSAVGNLCYLTSKDNRSKKDKTLWEDAEGRASFSVDQDFIDYIMYPPWEKLSFKNSPNNEFQVAYKLFIKERQEELKNEFKRLVQLYYS